MIAELSLLAAVTSTTFQDITQFTQRDLKDLAFTARKVKAVQRELKEINDDFGQTYRFDKIEFQYKEPLKLRLEATVEETSAIYIIDGAMQMIRVPRLRQNVKQNLENAPGRRQTPLDFGVLTPGMFRDLFEAKFVRQDRATGHAIYDFTYKNSDDTSRHRVWVDTDKGITAKREWFNQRGRQMATFNYENPQKVNGVWVPTMVSVRNVKNVVAGVTKYDGVKVNSGIPDSTFEIR